MIQSRPMVVALCLLSLAAVMLVLREPAAEAYRDFLTWIFSEQRAFHKIMTESLGAFADKTGWSTATTVVLGSFMYGVFHAAGPGHGKVILSTYLLTQPERIGKSVAMSVAAALLQGVMAVLLVYGLFYVFGTVARDAKIAVLWSERISFVLIMGLGAMLAWRALRGLNWFGLGTNGAASAGHSHQHDHQGGQHGGNEHHGHDHEHSHGANGVCSTCGHSHMPSTEQLEQATDWRSVIGIIFSIGLRPCSGAVLVLVFARFADIPLAGIMAVAAISAGTAITVSALAILAVKARGLAVSLLGSTATRIDTAGYLIALVGGFILILLSYGLLASSWVAPVRSMGL